MRLSSCHCKSRYQAVTQSFNTEFQHRVSTQSFNTIKTHQHFFTQQCLPQDASDPSQRTTSPIKHGLPESSASPPYHQIPGEFSRSVPLVDTFRLSGACQDRENASPRILFGCYECSVRVERNSFRQHHDGADQSRELFH